MFIDSNGLRTSVDVQTTIDGVTYLNLRDQALQQRLGITEIADPVRGDDQYYFVNEIDAAPYIINTPKSVEQVRQLKASQVSSSRYDKEVAGITLPDGTKVLTDRQTQATITSALVRIQRKPDQLIDWKGVEGWVQLNKEAVEAIADAIGDHVQTCFTAEKVKLDQLAALTEFEDLVAFDPKV